MASSLGEKTQWDTVLAGGEWNHSVTLWVPSRKAWPFSFSYGCAGR